jgi:choloylglycine hydrolase
MNRQLSTIAALVTLLLFQPNHGLACTGISLSSSDGGVVVGRTVEWALGDAQHDRLVVFPRNKEFTGLTPEGNNGMKWQGRHGFVSITAYGQDYGPDGLNEAGLYVGMYYFPGFAKFRDYDSTQAARSLSVGDFMQWMLSSFETVAELRTQLEHVQVVNVEDPRFGGAPLPFHWKIADSTGECIVIEIIDGGKLIIHNAFLGVITNSPEYSWHLTNLRNYVGLTPEPNSPLTLGGVKLSPLGGGSGLRGLPGDFTPPSRFVRAAAFTASARPLASTDDAVFECFRILDNFNIPVGATAVPDKVASDITSATQITTVSDLKKRILYFHTMDNREVRKIDLSKIDFSKVRQKVIENSAERNQVVKELSVTP